MAPQRRRKVTKVVQDKAKGQVNKAATKARVIVKKAPPGAKTSVIVRKAPIGAKPGVFVRKMKSSTANSGITNSSTATSSPLSMTVEKAPSGAKPGVFVTPVKPGSTKDQKARADLKHAKAALATAK